MALALTDSARGVPSATPTGFLRRPPTPYRGLVMHDPAEFDAFYAATRDRLLLQTYALTGDLPASRGAVRDAYVAAWHHWRKVSRLEDPQTWVRPHAWTHAQRRHTARIWHRDKALDDETRATLDALSKLSPAQRKALLLTQLCSVSMDQMAREVGLTREAAEQTLQSATAQFSLHRDIPSPKVRAPLEALAARLEGVRFPRVTIVRRAGAARRRTHAGIGVAAALAALVGSGALVHQTGGLTPALGDASAHGESAPGTDEDEVDPATMLETEALLTSAQVNAVSPTRKVAEPKTSDNTDGSGINTTCQGARFADPDGLAALVRKFRFDGEPRLAAKQSVELSADERAAKAAYATTIGWFSGCTERRAQLLSTHEIKGVGDQADLLVLRTWQEPVRTFTIAVARTGSLVTYVVRSFDDPREPRLDPMVDLTAKAVNSLCQHEAAGACTTKPKATPVPPPRATRARGMLQEVDLPPVAGITKPWVGTDPVPPKTNAAATRCDNAEFRGKSLRKAATRTFVVPGAKLPTAFGLTETVGRFRKADQARDFVGTIRKSMAACEDKDLSTEVTQVHTQSSAETDLTIWHLETEVSDERRVQFQMSVMRRGTVVVQLGFVPDAGHSIGEGAFHHLSLRALERTANLGKKAPGN